MVRLLILIFCFLLLFSCNDSQITAGLITNPGSSSSSQNEIVYTFISSVNDVQEMRLNPNGNFALTQDIDLGTLTWEPVGTADAPFTGRFNGNNFKIKNLSYTGDTHKYLGLFGVTGDESIITNVHLEDVFIWNLNEGACTDQDSCATGALVGFSNGLIEMVELSGNSTVKGYRNVGGLVGVRASGFLRKISVTDGVVSETDLGGSENIGGIVGHLRGVGTYMNNCFYTGQVDAQNTNGVGDWREN